MKNKHPIRLFMFAFFPLFLSSATAQPPATLTFTQGGQLRLYISSTDPNLLFIPGDRITTITAQNDMLADRRLTSAGGVLFTSVATRTFTLFVETALGQTLSLVATPVKGEGRIYRLMSADPPVRPERRPWETARAYEQLLVALGRAVQNGTLSADYGEVAPLSDGVQVPVGLIATPRRAWAGNLFRADHYQLRNAGSQAVNLREQDFWKPGVRAVMFDSSAKTLLGGGSLMMTVIRSAGENDASWSQ